MNTFRSVTHTLIAAAWATGLATSAHAQSTRELDAALLQMSERGDLKDTGAPQVIQKPAQVRYELGAVVDVPAAQRTGLPVLALTPDGSLASQAQASLPWRPALPSPTMRVAVVDGSRPWASSDSTVSPQTKLAWGWPCGLWAFNLPAASAQAGTSACAAMRATQSHNERRSSMAK